MKNIKRKGYTLLELVVVIALLGVTIGMFSLVVANLVNVQNVTSDQYRYTKQLKTINDVTNDYISFVGLDNDDTSFVYSGSTPSSLTYSYDTYSYTLAFNNNEYKITNDYDGDVDYFKKTVTEELTDVESIVFTYNSDLALLNLKVVINGIENHLDYVVRTAYDYFD